MVQWTTSWMNSLYMMKRPNLNLKKKFKNNIKCPFCHKIGHKVEGCWMKRKIDSNKTEVSPSTSSNDKSSSSSSFSRNQITKKRRKLQNRCCWNVLKNYQISGYLILDVLLIQRLIKIYLWIKKINRLNLNWLMVIQLHQRKIGNVVIEPKPNWKMWPMEVSVQIWYLFENWLKAVLR